MQKQLKKMVKASKLQLTNNLDVIQYYDKHMQITIIQANEMHANYGEKQKTKVKGQAVRKEGIQCPKSEA